MSRQYKLCELVDFISTKLTEPVELVLNSSDPNLEISAVATLSSATKNNLSFYTNSLYREDLLKSNAGVIIISAKHKELVAHLNTSAFIVTQNPHAVYATIAGLYSESKDAKSDCNSNYKIHSTAVIGANCKIASKVSIGAYVCIGDNVEIADNVVIKPGVVIGDNCKILSGTLIHPKVVIYNNVSIGSNNIIHSGAVLGSDGFGFAFTDDKQWLKVPQLGGVVIGNNVEIGANTTIDCGAIENTVISDGVKLDNQIQIAHNVSIGKHTIVAAQVGIAGSSKIGDYCAFGGGSAISGHISVANGVKLAGFATVGQSIEQPGFYASGTGPALPYLKWRRLTVHFENLDKYISELKKLKKLKKSTNAINIE